MALSPSLSVNYCCSNRDRLINKPGCNYGRGLGPGVNKRNHERTKIVFITHLKMFKNWNVMKKKTKCRERWNTVLRIKSKCQESCWNTIQSDGAATWAPHLQDQISCVIVSCDTTHSPWSARRCNHAYPCICTCHFSLHEFSHLHCL